MKTHQLDPPDPGVLSEISPEVEVFHKLKNESRWMLRSRINPDEWHHTFVRDSSTY